MPDEPLRVAWVTGGAKGLGRAIALAFARRGYRVAIHYRTSEREAADTAREVKKAGSDAFSLKADLRESGAAARCVADIEKKWGRLDVLVNNAGSARNRTVAKMSDDEWREAIAVNLDAVFFATRAALPLLRASRGSLLNITSYLASRPARGAANYAAAKAGVIAFTKAVAAEEGRNRVRANALLPGFHVTDMNRDVWGRLEGEIRGQHLLPELPDRDEMANFAVSVAEQRSVTGQVFPFESRLA